MNKETVRICFKSTDTEMKRRAIRLCKQERDLLTQTFKSREKCADNIQNNAPKRFDTKTCIGSK